MGRTLERLGRTREAADAFARAAALNPSLSKN
jgi:predicted RNA polymerase sigma factor